MSLSNKTLTIAIALMVLVAPVAAFEITSVSGEANHGLTLTIIATGGGFLSKVPAPPMLWRNFDDGTDDGNLVALDSAFVPYGASSTDFESPRYSIAAARTGALGLRSRQPSGNTKSEYQFPSRASNEIFMSYWINIVNANCDGRKLPRIGYHGGQTRYYGGDGTTSTGLDTPAGAIPVPKNWARFFYGDNGQIAGQMTNDFPAFGEWYPIHHYHRLHTSTGALSWRQGKNSSVTTGRQTTIYPGRLLDGIWFGFMGVNGCVPTRDLIYIDDLYVDDTRSAVVLANSSNYASATWLDMQIPITWSDDFITVEVNTGLYENGQTAYLFVINSSGVVSTGSPQDGFPVVIGSTVDCPYTGEPPPCLCAGGGDPPCGDPPPGILTPPEGLTATGGYGDP